MQFSVIKVYFLIVAKNFELIFSRKAKKSNDTFIFCYSKLQIGSQGVNGQLARQKNED